MTSSPSPTTSTRAATISSCKERRSTSFPSLASLNPFRSKSFSEPLRPGEPFLVAPGIWSTDATAKVFGYIDTDATGRRRLSRSQSTGPDNRNRSPTPSGRNLLRIKNLLNRYKEVHKDDETDDFTKRTHRQKREYWERARQQARDEAKSERENSEWHSRRGRMRTVSQDDELTERGANPRTGVVSPYVTSDGSADGGHSDYIAKGLAKSPMSSTSRRTSDGRWQQIGGTWSFVEKSIPSPNRLHPNNRPTRHVSVKKLQDKLLAQMPGPENPEPGNLSIEQIRRYQQSVEQAYNLAGGRHAMVDPDTLPTPRQASPAFGTEGPSTPPNKLHKIKRKEVGSALQPQKSDDTMIVNHKQQSASARPPPVRMPSSDRQKVRIMSPSMTALGVPPRTPLDVEASFLGPYQHCSRTVSAGQFQSTLPLPPQTGQLAHHRQTQSQGPKQCPPEAFSVPQASSPTLSQSLPRLQFLHPSHFANLETSSYRRPSHLLPPSLRSGAQKREFVEDAATITTTTTLGRTKQRPGMQRSEGRNTVPRARRGDLEDHMKLSAKSPSQVPLIKIFEPSSPTKSTVENENARSSAYLHPMSFHNPRSKNGVHGDVVRASHHSRDQIETGPSHAPASHLNAPPNKSLAPSSQAPNQLSRCDAQSNIQRVISSESTDRTKQVKDSPKTTTESTRRTFPYPRNPDLDSVQTHVLQASILHSNRRSNQSHRDATPSALRGCEITRPSNILKAKTNETQQPAQSYSQASTASEGAAVHAARVATLEDNQHHHPHQSELEPRKRADQRVSPDQKPNALGAFGIVSDQAQQHRDTDGIGITQTFDHQGQNTSAPGVGTVMNTTEGRKELSVLAEPLPNSEGGVCFAGNWANNDSDDNDTRSVTTLSTNAEELLTRRRSLLRRSQELAQWLAALEGITQPKSYFKFAQQSLWHMMGHVASTLCHDSPAIKALTMIDSENTGSKERLFAAKEVTLAVLYVLILLNVMMFLRKLVVMTLRVAYWVWHPFMAVAIVIRWCLIV